MLYYAHLSQRLGLKLVRISLDLIGTLTQKTLSKEGDISSMSKSFVTSSRYFFGDMTLNSEFDRLAALCRVLQGLEWSPENCMWGGHT